MPLEDRVHTIARDALRRAGGSSSTGHAAALLVRADAAAERGDYGVAAALVLRARGREYAVYDESALFSEGDPLGHAECRTLSRLPRIVANAGGDESDLVPWDAEKIFDVRYHAFFRSVDTDGEGLFAYLTLEPCPMCTVALLNAGVDEIVVLRTDRDDGALCDGRLSRLGPAWEAIARARGLRTVTSPPEVPFGLLLALDEVLARSRRDRDGALESCGVVDRARMLRALHVRAVSGAGSH